MAEETPGSNSTSALAKLLNSLNLPTLALILLTGGGNFLATENNAQINRHEIQKAIDEVHRIFENQQRRENAYAQIEETNRIVKELKVKTGQ